MSNLALYEYARLRTAAERVLAATDPGEEKRLGQALHDMAEVIAVIDRLDGAWHDEPDQPVHCERCAPKPRCSRCRQF